MEVEYMLKKAAETVDTYTFTPPVRSVFTPGDKKKGKKGKKSKSKKSK